MRSIPLKIGAFDAKPVFSELMSFASEQPYTFEEMRQAVAILDKIEKPTLSGELLLEEAEHEFMLKRIGLARFVRVDRDVLAAIDAVREAKKVPVQTVKKGR